MMVAEVWFNELRNRFNEPMMSVTYVPNLSGDLAP